MVADILRLMGQPFNKKILDELIEEVDADSEEKMHFISFKILFHRYFDCICIFAQNLAD